MNERHDDLQEIIDAALREMAAEEGDGFDPQACNLAEFCRRTGLTRSRARTVRAHGFRALPHGNSGRRAAPGVLTGHTGLVDDLLRKGVTNSQVIFERLLGQGYAGGLTTVKTYIAAHRDLVPAKRRQAAPQGCRGQRFRTAPGDGEMAAVAATFSYLAEKRRLASIETLLRLSRLPRREPKTFEGFDFSRIQGRDSAALGKLPSLADLYAHRNVAFVGPGGIGKTHLAQAYGRECCMRGLKTYYIKATELRDRFQKAVQRGNTSRVVSSLVKPSCLIVDEVGRCVYDRPCTDLFFDVVDRRYEKEGPNAMVLTSNIAPSGWDEFFTGDDTLLCALDRLFDKASVFVMRGPSYRGRELDTYSVEAVPQAVKVRGIQPEGM